MRCVVVMATASGEGVWLSWLLSPGEVGRRDVKFLDCSLEKTRGIVRLRVAAERNGNEHKRDSLEWNRNKPKRDSPEWYKYEPKRDSLEWNGNESKQSGK